MRQGELLAGIGFENVFKYLRFPCSLHPSCEFTKCNQCLTELYPKKRLIIVMTLAHPQEKLKELCFSENWTKCLQF